MMILQSDGPLNQRIDMGTVREGAGQLKSMGCLAVAVETETGENESVDLGHFSTFLMNYLNITYWIG